MTDIDLFTFGCGIAFLVCAGFYVYARESFLGPSSPQLEPESVRPPDPVLVPLGSGASS